MQFVSKWRGAQQLATTINQRARAASVAMSNTPYFVSKAQTALNGAAMPALVNPNAFQGRAHSIVRYSSFPGLGRLGAVRSGLFCCVQGALAQRAPAADLRPCRPECKR
jgi:hypothetical protein